MQGIWTGLDALPIYIENENVFLYTEVLAIGNDV